MTNYLQLLSPEEKLLLSLCRLKFSEPQKSETGKLMLQITDWTHFVDLANEHGIIALCWYNITETGNSSNIPAGHLEKLHAGYLKSLTRNVFLFSRLEEIVILAEKENIKIVLLKGLALEKTIYGERGLRQMTDIDLLAAGKEAIRLRKILIKNGFESAPLKSPLYEFVLPHFNKHIPVLIKDNCSVEIHYKLFEQKENSLTEKLMELSVPLNINDHEVYIPSPQLFFLNLVRHLGSHESHGESQLRLYADLYNLLDSCYNDIINKQLIGFAIETNLEKQLAGKLYLLNSYWKVEYPDWLIVFISQFDHSLQREKFLSFIKQHKGNRSDKIASGYIRKVAAIPGIFRKVLYITGFIFPSLTYMKYKYKAKTRAGAVLYYPVRWVRIVKFLAGGRR